MNNVTKLKPGVVPGMVITELWDKMGQSKEQQKENFAKSAKNLPVGFVATAEDVSISCVLQSTGRPNANFEKIAEAYLYCVG